MRWTTMGLSAGTELAARTKETLARETAARPEAEPKPVDWKKRIVSLWIPAILGLGLLMAFGYVGTRIVAGKSQTQSTAPPAVIQTPEPVNVPTVAPPPKPAPKPAVSPANFTVITPQPGEQYLQVAAVTPHMVLTYVDTLRKTNLEAVIAPGPTPDLLRVLVGPFSDRDSMEKAKAQLHASGRSPIIRSY